MASRSPPRTRELDSDHTPPSQRQQSDDRSCYYRKYLEEENAKRAALCSSWTPQRIVLAVGLVLTSVSTLSMLTAWYLGVVSINDFRPQSALM